VLIYYGCRLRAAVTTRAVEINGRDTMFVRSAFGCGAVIHRSGCDISHTFTVAPFVGPSLGQEVRNLRAKSAFDERVGGPGFTCGVPPRRKGQCIMLTPSVRIAGNCGIQRATKRTGFGRSMLSLSHSTQSEAAPHNTHIMLCFQQHKCTRF
jgi:hypothetical protein